ncbi:MAG: ABC transporter permease subunit [Bacillota bacterium]|nr:ABC transporter permease subunit [Bacillota bacterium]
MNILYANVVSEIQKLCLKKRTLFLLIISALIPIGTALILSVFQNNVGIIPITKNQFPIFVLSIFTSYFLPLVIAMVTIDLFSGEFGDRNIKIVLLRPISRFKIYTSKILSIGIFIIVNLAIAFIFSCLALILIKGNYQFINGFLKGLVAYGVSIVPMIAIAIAITFIGQFFKSTGSGLTISILIYIAISIISRLSPQFSRITFTSYTDWYQLWIGSSILIGKVISSFIIILSYSMIFFGIGFYLFDKKEL